MAGVFPVTKHISKEWKECCVGRHRVLSRFASVPSSLTDDFRPLGGVKLCCEGCWNQLLIVERKRKSVPCGFLQLDPQKDSYVGSAAISHSSSEAPKVRSKMQLQLNCIFGSITLSAILKQRFAVLHYVMFAITTRVAKQ